MALIKHEVVIDIDQLRKDVCGKIVDIEGAGFIVRGVIFNPKTWHDIIIQPQVNKYIGFGMHSDLGFNLFGIHVICDTKTEEMEYHMVLQ